MARLWSVATMGTQMCWHKSDHFTMEVDILRGIFGRIEDEMRSIRDGEREKKKSSGKRENDR